MDCATVVKSIRFLHSTNLQTLSVKISWQSDVEFRSYRGFGKATFVIFKTVDKIEFRVIIKHCFLMVRNTVEAKQWLYKRYGDSAPRKSTIINWYTEFKSVFWDAHVILCSNGRKKSHCLLATRAACSQLRLGVAIGRNVHTIRFNRKNVHIARHLTAGANYALVLNATFSARLDTIVDCVPRATWWRCDSYEYRPRYARAGTLRTRHNRHHVALGTQSTIMSKHAGKVVLHACA